MHDFWSMRGIKTNLANGFDCLNANMQSVNDIPVAIGTTKQLLINVKP
jgi:homoserine kinase